MSPGILKYFVVKDDSGNFIGDSEGWAMYSSFNVVLEDEPILDLTQEPRKEEFIEVMSQSNKPCHAYYYGVAHCSCGKCGI
jgi:hypothetical protein